MKLVSHATKLRQIKTRYFSYTSVKVSDLVALNEARKKLAGACKVAIFINEKQCMNLKWAGKTHFSLIEIKRSESCDKNHVYRECPYTARY